MRAEEILKKRAGLSPEKQRLLMRRMQGAPRAAVVAAPTISPLPRTDAPETPSIIQEDYLRRDRWCQEQSVAQRSRHYHRLLRLTGLLNVAHLEESFREVVRRHDVLRSTFRLIDGEHKQLIASDVENILAVVDLREIPAAGRTDEALKLAAVEAFKKFDLAHDSVLKSFLYRIDEEEHLLLLLMHHLAFDGESQSLFINELGNLYRAFTKGTPSPLAPLTLQYRDFAFWQREQLKGERFERRVAYWKRQLGGESFPALAQLRLPFERPRLPEQQPSFIAGSIKFSVSPDTFKSMKRLGEQKKATLFIILLASIKALMFRYSGQEKIFVGSHVSGREDEGLKLLIGKFGHSQWTCADVSGSLRFSELLERVREAALEATEYSDIPFPAVLERLRPERLSAPKMTNAPFVWFNLSALTDEGSAPVRLGDSGIELEEMALALEDGAQQGLGLSFTAKAGPESLDINIKYEAELYDSEHVLMIARHFERLLASIVSDPDQQIAELPLLTAEEERSLLLTDEGAVCRQSQPAPSQIERKQDWLEWA